MKLVEMSYFPMCVACGKKLRKFRASCDIGCLKHRHSTCDHSKTYVEMSGF